MYSHKDKKIMSKTYRDAKGGRLNGEIWCFGLYSVNQGKVYGTDPWGGPKHKYFSKRHVSRLRRREDKLIIKKEIYNKNENIDSNIV